MMNANEKNLSARQLVVSGQVQGVGFRPFIYRLATSHNLTGWVRNCVGVVEINVQGQSEHVETFIEEIFDKKPPLAKPELESEIATDIGDFDTFKILKSQEKGEVRISVPADLFLCYEKIRFYNYFCTKYFDHPQLYTLQHYDHIFF